MNTIEVNKDQPTPEMVRAFRAAHDEHASHKIPKIYFAGQREEANIVVGYRAMMAAAPELETEQSIKAAAYDMIAEQLEKNGIKPTSLVDFVSTIIQGYVLKHDRPAKLGLDYLLFLDDERDPPENWYRHGIEVRIVRNYDQFVEMIQNHGLPAQVSFDHDLGQEKTGLDCFRHMIEVHRRHYSIQSYLPNVFVHSMNPVGAKNLRDELASYSRTLEW